MTRPDTAAGQQARRGRLLVAALLLIAITAGLFALGRLRQPSYGTGFFGSQGGAGLALKSELASFALGLACLQVLLALRLYGKLPGPGQSGRLVPLTHRVAGFIAVAVTVPVALHCLIAYGVQLTSARVAVHSLAGCFLYGAVVAKLLLVHSRRLPGWALPVAGGTLAVLIAVLWATAALWYYSGYRLA